MNKAIVIGLALLFLIGGVIFATGQGRNIAILIGWASAEREEEIHWCPMHPFYKVKKYGICPYCNMELEVYQPGPGADEAEPTLILTSQQIQQAGVRTEKVERRELVSEIETTGLVQLNRERNWTIDVRFEGWVEELFINNEGDQVRKGDPIAKVYSNKLIAVQDDYLRSLAAGDPARLESARKRLELMGIDPEEIRELEKRKSPSPRLTIRSRYTGTVMHKNVKPGERIPANGHLAEVADLSELWVFADIYDREIDRVRVGQEVRLKAGKETLRGTIDLIEPRMDIETQTLRVRIRVKNDPPRLHPGQFIRALLIERLPDTLSVSEHAIIPTGRRYLVILDLGGGRFTAREVKPGRRWLSGKEAESSSRNLDFYTGHGRYHEVLSGLKEGDLVVTSGAFLLHAEAQIRNLIEKMAPEEINAIQARSAWSGRKLTRPHVSEGLPFADSAEATWYRETPKQSWHTRWPKVRKSVEALFRDYFLLNTAVASGKIRLAGEYTEGIQSATAALRENLSGAFDADVAAALRAFADRVDKAATGIQEASDRKQASGRFGAMSLALEEYLGEFGNPTNKPIYQFYCGMAKRMVGSPTERWFQPDTENRNPFGMPRCGHVEKELP